MGRRQISVASLFVAMTVAAMIFWLAVSWWQLLLLLCVSILPAIVLLWAISKLRKNSDRRLVSVKSGVWLCVLSAFFLTLYFLSIGPAMYVDVTCLSTRAGDSTPWWLIRFYEPLQIFDSPANPLRSVMEQYSEICQDYCGVIRAGR